MSSPAAITHGPALVGTFLNMFLYGIMINQCFTYFSRYPEDRLWLKILVVVLLIADTLNSVFDMWWIYDALVNNFMNPVALQSASWVFTTDPALVGIIASITQLFFAWRIKVLTSNWWAVTLVVITSLAAGCGGVGTAIAVQIIPEFERFREFRVIVIVWLLGAAVCDSVITLLLTWHLRRHKTGFQGTDDILNKIIRLTVQNGLITAVCAIIDLVAFLASPTGLHLVFNLPLAKLYTNSLMSSLNSREGRRSRSQRVSDQNNRETITARQRGLDVINFAASTRPEVYVHVEQHEMVDTGDSKSRMEWQSDAESPVARTKRRDAV